MCLELLSGSDFEMHLQRRTGVYAKIDAARQTPTLQTLGVGIVSAATKKLGAIARVAMHVAVGRNKRDATSELGIPVARCEQTRVVSIAL